ncbi:hypothetical protein D3867_19545 (plasmid) [Azospirillum argentinense]|uniref:Uncharacterized protein n=1 Tax=Azospirillum brasilense TaxID=192 RepID=A0A4D8Q2Q4_AZOBR|nr:hypothetical protein D3867_19545 [Azospirillum argentinense]
MKRSGRTWLTAWRALLAGARFDPRVTASLIHRTESQPAAALQAPRRASTPQHRDMKMPKDGNPLDSSPVDRCTCMVGQQAIQHVVGQPANRSPVNGLDGRAER